VVSNAIQEVLNKQVANWTVLYVKLHNYHWYVKGPHFYTLHEKFEELYNEAAGLIDELAERLLAVGGKPVASLKACLETADIKEASGNENAEQMVAAIMADFNALINELKSGRAAAEAADDEITADML